MWLLLFLAVVLALLVAVLTHTRFTPHKIAVIGMMAALSFVAYEFFRIPNVLGTGSSPTNRGWTADYRLPSVPTTSSISSSSRSEPTSMPLTSPRLRITSYGATS